MSTHADGWNQQPTSGDGTTRVHEFFMPFSSIASSEARAAYVTRREKDLRDLSHGTGLVSAVARADDIDIGELRRVADQDFILPTLEKQIAHWGQAVKIETEEIGGVPVERFTPAEGLPAGDRNKVLINLHGGGFMVGGRWHGRLESIPICGHGKIAVVSVDYRMAPEHTFPAATEDVAIVYRDLLRRYEPENVGIYGSSAGAILTAQAVAFFLEEGLPTPGAIGMFGGSGQSPGRGDSVGLACHIFDTIPNMKPETALAGLGPYFQEIDEGSRLAEPALWGDLISSFPPSLLVTGSRAFEMSSIIDTHNRLTLAGVESHLHVWDGVGHCFYLTPDLPESHEFETIAVNFFRRHLG